LIDGSLCHVLSRKTEEDKLVKYQAHPRIYNKALPYRGVFIAALICMDASNSSATCLPFSQRQAAINRYLERLKTIKESIKGDRVAFCIPSRMSQIDSCQVATEWSGQLPGSVVILANTASRKPSVIQPEGKLIHCECRGGNTLRIVSWPEFPY
jgi:hypothetical protein